VRENAHLLRQGKLFTRIKRPIGSRARIRDIEVLDFALEQFDTEHAKFASALLNLRRQRHSLDDRKTLVNAFR